MNKRLTRSSFPSPTWFWTWFQMWMSGMRMSSLPTFPASSARAACRRPVVKEIEIPHWEMRRASDTPCSRDDSTRTAKGQSLQ